MEIEKNKCSDHLVVKADSLTDEGEMCLSNYLSLVGFLLIHFYY